MSVKKFFVDARASQGADIVGELWSKYRRAWSDSTVDLQALRSEVHEAFALRKTDVVLGMLLCAIERDLDEL